MPSLHCEFNSCVSRRLLFSSLLTKPSSPLNSTDGLRDCKWQVNGNAGCGVGVTAKSPSYGPPFNSARGGIYDLERTPTEIKAWFWTRAVRLLGSLLGPSNLTFPHPIYSSSLTIVVKRIQEVNAGTTPADVRTLGQASVETAYWGTPTARFTNQQCDINAKFGLENVIINTTFCQCYSFWPI